MSAGTPPLRVLIVDDDFRVGEIHRALVDDRPGLEALPPVRDLHAARAAVAALAPDLLLLDVYLPDGDGIELGRTVDVDRFVLSAANDSATITRALRSGALHYLVKPFDPRALQDRLDRYVRYRNLLASPALTQDVLDRAGEILHGGIVPAGASSGTAEALIAALGDGEGSIGELAERVGVSKATAQRHLSALAARGTVQVTLRYGTTGRPEHRYRCA